MAHNLELSDERLTIFQSWSKNMVRYGLQAKIGRAWMSEKGGVAYQIGYFLFLAGEVDCELLPLNLEYLILISEQENWQNYLSKQESFTPFTRYAFDVPNGATFIECQNQLALHSTPYECKAMNAKSFNECRKNEWSRDLRGIFHSFSSYREQGAIGFVIYHGKQLIAGISSAFVYHNALEVEIAVHPDYQCRGLAKKLAAKMVISCFEKGIVPLWDAHNIASAKVAIAVGYPFLGTYSAYETT
ncbi:GNAT family N-acetyltransferase [Enterococcus cecorum]|uniref:GNAT family N-acetyltransferase n=1 Tax=Enterococcus cecorum TaxID=44008 RepID=A0AAW8TU94_9ENTE|nr:GNAT family N-acetyltransferase [Enterococcus cecorum]MDT2797244.1 GNAT family N-acetyltransferase [Enterococcus cecorum]